MDTLLDTNVIARYLIGDIRDQYLEARELLRTAVRKNFCLIVTTASIMELNHVMLNHYSLDREKITESLLRLFNLSAVTILDSEIVLESLKLYRRTKSVSLEDSYLIVYCLNNNLSFYSFDKKAVTLFKKLLREKQKLEVKSE